MTTAATRRYPVEDITSAEVQPGRRGYRELNALPPSAFLRPEDFRTSFDSPNDGYALEQHVTGLRYSLAAEYITITCVGTWAARMRDGSVVTSCEGIGYHAHTAELLQGFLDGPAPVLVYRYGTDWSADGTEIKPRTCPRCGKTIAPGMLYFDGADCPGRRR